MRSNAVLKALKGFIWLLIIAAVLVFSTVEVKAADLNAKYIFKYPSQVTKGEDFTMHVYINAPKGVRISQARLVFKFDPDYIKIDKVRAYQDVFCRYPTENNQYILDNTTGDFLLTGYSTGTQDCPFVQPDGKDILFLDLVITPKKTGSTVIDIVYEPSDNVIATDSSLLMDDKSPAQFILAAPNDPKLKIVDKYVPTPTRPASSTTNNRYVPSTGVSPLVGFIIAIILIILGVITIKFKSFEKRVESSRYKNL